MAHLSIRLKQDQWMLGLVSLIAMVHMLPLHLTPPEHFLPICPVATLDEGSSPVAIKSEPHKVHARRDVFKRRAVYRRRLSLPEAVVISHERLIDVPQKFHRMGVGAAQLHVPTPTRPAASGRRLLALVPRPSVGGSAASVKLLPMVKCYA